MSDAFSSSAPQGALRARLKWFNPTKGFGFAVLEDQGDEAFVHITALQQVGRSTLGEGAEILCSVEPSPRGLSVKEIYEVLSEGQDSPSGGRDFAPRGERRPFPPRAPRHGHEEFSGPTETVSGAVKWYNVQKGFGFVSPDDGGKDIFVHKSCLDRAGLSSLPDGQRVSMSVRHAAKGREAVSVSLA